MCKLLPLKWSSLNFGFMHYFPFKCRIKTWTRPIVRDAKFSATDPRPGPSAGKTGFSWEFLDNTIPSHTQVTLMRDFNTFLFMEIACFHEGITWSLKKIV